MMAASLWSSNTYQPDSNGQGVGAPWWCAMSKQSVWLRCICVYQLITAETHAVGRHHPVDPVASCLFERSEMLAVVKVRWE